MIAALVKLGLWQIHRGQEKSTWLAQMHMRSEAPAKTPNDVSQVEDFAHIKLSGHVDNQQQLLLDNKFHQHHPGFHVLTALKIPGQARWVLLNRGWLPRGYRRIDLPKLPPLPDDVSVKGIVYYPKKQLLSLGSDNEQAGQWPRIVQRIDFVTFERLLKRPLQPYILVLDAKDKLTFTRDWRPVVMMPERHYAYAFQWFALALTLLVIVIATSLKRR